MPNTINDKLISWASDVEEGTIRQAEKTARLPIVDGHVALMPDAHLGIGATVGSVIPTSGAIIPAAVGVDIGCGMIAVETDLTADKLLADLLWAQAYALGNREQMMDTALRAFFRYVGSGRERRRINCHHNFTALEIHDGRELWITRKGAIRADVTDHGVIPGSMGTRSYIVRGKGSAASYKSCSHGAGRRLSRSQARKRFTVDDMAAQMAGTRSWQRDSAADLIDELPAAD